MKLLLALLLALMPTKATALGPVDRGNKATYNPGTSADKNFIINPDCNLNTNNITASGGSLVVIDSTETIRNGTSCGWNSSALAQTIKFSTATLANDTGLLGDSCAAYFKYTGDGDSMVVYLESSGGTQRTADLALKQVDSGVTQPGEVTYPCEEGAKLVFESTVANADWFYVGEVFYGKNQNIENVAQNQVVAVGYITGTAACDWSRTNATLGAFGTDADCPGVTVTENNTSFGTLQTTDADLPNFTVNGLAPGKYKVTITGANIPATGSAGDTQTLAIYDGTSYDGRQAMQYASSGAHPVTLVGVFNYTQSANVTFSVHGASSASAVVLRNTSTQSRLQIIIERIPSQGEQTTRMACGGTAKCENEFSAKVSSAGVVSDESVGWINGNASVSDTSLYAITWDTSLFTVAPNCTPAVQTNAVGADESIEVAASTSGISIRTSANTTKTAYAFTIRCSRVGADRVSVPAPLIAGGATTPSASTKIELNAELNCDAASAITSQSGTVANAISAIGNRSTTSCALTIVTGVFSTIWSCTPTAKSSTVQAMTCVCSSATSCTVYGANADYDAYVEISGAR